MGCAPPEKRHQSIPAINAVPKARPVLSPRQSDQSKNSTQTNEHNLLQPPIPKLPSNESLKSQRRAPRSPPPQAPLLQQKRQSIQSPQRFSYEHRDSPEKPIEKEVIRIMSPRDKPRSPKKPDQQEASKLVSVHSLDIVSRIKTPKEEGQRKGEKKEVELRAAKSSAKSSKVQEINITFNCNDFAVAQSKGAGQGTGRRGWRQQALLKQLRGMNSENFKRIPVNSRNFQ